MTLILYVGLSKAVYVILLVVGVRIFIFDHNGCLIRYSLLQKFHIVVGYSTLKGFSNT